MLPKTYLLTSPNHASGTDVFGQGMRWQDLMKGLRQANPDLWCPTPDHFPSWYPGKAKKWTCLWLYHDDDKKRKVCAFRLNVIPEFTQLGPTGSIIDRGWRSVLFKVIAVRAATRGRLERIFKCDLSYEHPVPKHCVKCIRKNKIEAASGNTGLCVPHLVATQHAKQHQELKEIAACHSRKAKLRDPRRVTLPMR